jgi:two-component system, chemotaxis family, chemotaxis protein CheY
MRVLVVDDSVSMRQMISIILKSAGHEVIEATEGHDALTELTADIDLVLTDYNMPNMNGVELVRRIRSEGVRRSVPIVIVTTESEDEKKQAGRRAGATGWIVKPFDRSRLLAVVDKVADVRASS